jgi:hypothetical protein
MSKEGDRTEGEKADHQVPQHAHDLVVLANQQQADKGHSERRDQPAGIDTGKDPDPGRSRLQIGRNGDHVDNHDRHQERCGDPLAVALPRQRLEVVTCHQADMRGDGLDYGQEGGNQEGHPGQLIAGLSPHGDGRPHVRGVVVRCTRNQFWCDASQKSFADYSAYGVSIAGRLAGVALAVVIPVVLRGRRGLSGPGAAQGDLYTEPFETRGA